MVKLLRMRTAVLANNHVQGNRTGIQILIYAASFPLKLRKPRRIR
jgi:hypothetical protein